MNLGETSRCKIPLTKGPVRSLCWQNEELVDSVGGGARFRLDGSTVPTHICWADRFDAAIMSRDGTYSVIYEKLGTKGLVLRGNKLLREINRSFYQAEVYEYPIAILNLPTGAVALAHCPEAYNRLEIEEIESGNKLTLRQDESPDFFHSRLQISNDGAYLLSAGWVWHPLDRVLLFSIHDALRHPNHLDNPIRMNLPDELFGVNAAAFHGDNALLLVGNAEDDVSAPTYIAEFKLKEGAVTRKCALESVPGTIMPVGPDHFIGFYEHPKLFEISSGKVIRSWPELNSGKQNSSIIWHHEMPPPLALDTTRRRFAVADASNITVIQLG
jgi:hypothetical protein